MYITTNNSYGYMYYNSLNGVVVKFLNEIAVKFVNEIAVKFVFYKNNHITIKTTTILSELYDLEQKLKESQVFDNYKVMR